MEMRDLVRGALNPWSCFGGAVLGIVMFGAVMLLLFVTRPGPPQTTPPTAVLTKINAPSPTVPVPTPTPAFTPTPTSDVPPPPPEGSIVVGAYVQISGTGGDGLRMRLEPGLQGSVLMIGQESEVFVVSGGPEQIDNYTWWYLTAPFDADRQGWAVSNYLTVIQRP